jgi:hypothetical protein
MPPQQAREEHHDNFPAPPPKSHALPPHPRLQLRRPGRGRLCRADVGPSPSFPRGLGFYMFYSYFYSLCKKILHLNESMLKKTCIVPLRAARDTDQPTSSDLNCPNGTHPTARNESHNTHLLHFPRHNFLDPLSAPLTPPPSGAIPHSLSLAIARRRRRRRRRGWRRWTTRCRGNASASFPL